MKQTVILGHKKAIMAQKLPLAKGNSTHYSQKTDISTHKSSSSDCHGRSVMENIRAYENEDRSDGDGFPNVGQGRLYAPPPETVEKSSSSKKNASSGNPAIEKSQVSTNNPTRDPVSMSKL